MAEMLVKVYTKKEINEIKAKYPDKVFGSKKVVIDIIENEDMPGTYKTKCGFILYEICRYYTKADLEADGNFKWMTGIGKKIFIEENK